MKSILLVFFPVIFLCSCTLHSKTGATLTTTSPRSITDTNSLIVGDSSLYTLSFLKSLQPQKAHWKFRLDSNKLVFNGRDTILFPDFIPLNEALLFTGKKGDLKIHLYVKRVLISTIDYKIEVIRNNNPPEVKSGSADLSPYFFVQSKKDVINPDITKTADYWDNNSDYLISIRIGETQDNKQLSGKVELKLKDLEINSDNCPVLTEKSDQL